MIEYVQHCGTFFFTFIYVNYNETSRVRQLSSEEGSMRQDGRTDLSLFGV